MRAVFHQQAALDSAGGRHDGADAIAGSDHEARVEHVREELREIVAAVQGDVGPDVGAFAVDLVARRADSFEHLFTGEGIARSFFVSDQRLHLGDDLVAVGVASVTHLAPVAIEQLTEILVLEGLDAARLIQIDGRGRDLLLADLSQQPLRPACSLSQQFDGRRLEARLHRGKLFEDDI